MFENKVLIPSVPGGVTVMGAFYVRISLFVRFYCIHASTFIVHICTLASIVPYGISFMEVQTAFITGIRQNVYSRFQYCKNCQAN